MNEQELKDAVMKAAIEWRESNTFPDKQALFRAVDKYKRFIEANQ